MFVQEMKIKLFKFMSVKVSRLYLLWLVSKGSADFGTDE